MKNICILLLIASLFACSSDDGRSYRQGDLVGLWFLTGLTAGGDTVAVDICEDRADFISILGSEFEYYRYRQDCSVADMDLGFWKLQGNKIILETADPALQGTLTFVISNYTGDQMTLTTSRNGQKQKMMLQRQTSVF